jgi:hypothetical protein
LRALTRFMSRRGLASSSTPYSPARLAMCAAYALATIALVGVQPSFTQVPPNFAFSITATFMPAPESRAASAGPA